MNTYLAVAPGDENDLAAVVRARRLAHDRPGPLVLSVADLLASDPVPAQRATGTDTPDPVRVWTAILLDAGAAADELFVYRQRHLTTLAANALLLGRWIDTTDTLDRTGPPRLTHAVTPVVALADLLAGAPDDAVTDLDDPATIGRLLDEMAGNGAPLPHPTRTWEGHRILDTPALRSLSAVPVDRGRDLLPARIRKLNPGADGGTLQALHRLAEETSGTRTPCAPHSGNQSTKACATARLIALCDRIAHLPSAAEEATVEQIAERSRSWAASRTAELHHLLHTALFAPPTSSGRTP